MVGKYILGYYFFSKKEIKNKYLMGATFTNRVKVHVLKFNKLSANFETL